MSNLSGPVPPQPYGKGGRKIVLPVKASAQIYQGGMVAQPSGACVAATAGSETAGVIGIAEHDALGGSADGDVRIVLLTDQEFIMNAGTNTAPTDATPLGTILYAQNDHAVGTVNTGSALPIAGRFVGMEDDGRVRLYVGWMACLTGAP